MGTAPKTAIYVRVSTLEQAEKGYSLDAQLKLLNDYCSQHKKIVYKAYIDRGISGKSMTNRKALQDLLQEAKQSKFNEVIVWKVNRLARNMVDLLDIIESLNRSNIAFHSYSEHFETETPMGKFGLQMLAAVGELESQTISDNVKLGLKQRFKAGKRVSNPSVLGYDLAQDNNSRKTDLSLRINPDESYLVLLIFNLYASGKGLKSITNLLNYEGYKTKTGKLFSINTIKQTLNNVLYTGKILYKGDSDSPEMMVGEHPPIISNDLWNKVHQLYDKKRVPQKKTVPNDYPLTSLLKCPQCQSGVVAFHTKRLLKDGSVRRHRYYLCGSYHNKGRVACKPNCINADDTERHVFTRLQQFFNEPLFLKDLIHQINAKLYAPLDGLKIETLAIDKEIQSLASRKIKLLDLFEEDHVSKASFVERLDEIQESLNSKIMKKELLLQQNERIKTELVSYEQVMFILKQLIKVIDHSSNEEKRTLLRLLLDKITIDASRDISSIQLHFNPLLHSGQKGLFSSHTL